MGSVHGGPDKSGHYKQMDLLSLVRDNQVAALVIALALYWLYQGKDAAGAQWAKLLLNQVLAWAKANQKHLLVAAGLAAAVYYGPRLGQEQPTPAPAPAPLSDAPDLRGVFARNSDRQQARDDARAAGALLQGLADVIEYDGRRLGQEKPGLASGVQVEDLRLLAREFALPGEPLDRRYPGLGDLLGGYIELKVGTDGGELTPERRAAWQKAYEALAARAMEASL